MQTINNGYHALGVILDVNWERFVFPAVLVLCLSLWSYVGSMGMFWF